MSEDSLNASKMNVLPGDYITTIKIYYFIHEFCLVRWKAAKNAPWMVCDGAHASEAAYGVSRWAKCWPGQGSQGCVPGTVWGGGSSRY